MMSKTFAVPAAVAAPTPAIPFTAADVPMRGAGRPLFAPRPRRLATGPVPAAFIVLVWMLLWTWVTVGVAAPLSRMGAPEPARAVAETSVRA